jgi:alkylation response protein AidB-like acyl-CoA dehydrogenase
MHLSIEHQQVADMTRRFTDGVIRPEAERLDREEAFAGDIYKAMGESGLFGITTPEAYGGAGLDCLAYSIVMEELSRGYASIADQCGLVELLTTLLCKYGDEAQRQKWISPLIRAEQRGAYCITEAGAGSDVSGIKTTAVRDGDSWVLNGNKLWIHNAPVADVGFVLVRTDPAAGKRGMSILIVNLHAKGVSRGPKEHKLGQRSSQVGELNFENVKVPADALLGVEGRGFHMMMSVLEKGRVGIASLAVGITQAALEASVEQAKLRKQFGQAIADFQGIQFMLADMAKDCEASRLLVRSAA